MRSSRAVQRITGRSLRDACARMCVRSPSPSMSGIITSVMISPTGSPASSTSTAARAPLHHTVS